MKDIQQVFNELQEKKALAKEIRGEYKEVLDGNGLHAELIEKMQPLKDEKKNIELSVQRDMGSRWEEFEAVKTEIKSLNEMISDIALNSLVDGKSIQVRDGYDNLFDPIYTVNYSRQGRLAL